MNYEQVKQFDQTKAGTVPLECLKNNRLGYGIPAKYPNATTAWQHTQQHFDAIPTGLYVPLFYTFDVDGHINEQFPDGTVWSDGVKYADKNDYLRKHPSVKYLGWGESINDVRVIQESEDGMSSSEYQQLSTYVNEQIASIDQRLVAITASISQIEKLLTDMNAGNKATHDDIYQYIAALNKKVGIE